jgi:hypothetical protein
MLLSWELDLTLLIRKGDGMHVVLSIRTDQDNNFAF